MEEATATTGTKPREVLADAGFASEANFLAMEVARVRAYVSLGREGKAGKRPTKDAVASRRMRRRLAARGGRRKYARRKHLVDRQSAG